jgi:Fic family protein
MNSAIQRLTDLPLSSRLLREIHQILLQGVRGEHRQPGQFRTSQNWIGGSTLADAIFIPPHHNLVHDLMNDLEKFIHDDHLYTPHLIKIGLIHYQFETIHPFLDGNGRIGRLLITLYLVSKGLLDKPILYLSDFFERHRSLYYDNLMIVRNQSNLTQWLKFFLVGVSQTAKKSIQTFKNILILQKNVEEMLFMQSSKRLVQAKKLLNHLYVEPSCNLTQVMEVLQCSKEMANRLLRDFVEMGLLKEITGYRRNRIFVFEPYVCLFLDEKPL